MGRKELGSHYLSRLQDQLAHARQAFSMVAGNYFGTEHDLAIAPEHVVYAHGVYQGLREAISQVIREIGGDLAFKDWTPRGTVPGELRGFLLEESVSSGLLLAWKVMESGTCAGLTEALQISADNLRKAVRADSTAPYCRIEGFALSLAKSERAPEAMQVLGDVRLRYKRNLEKQSTR